MAALRSLSADAPETVRLGKRVCKYCRGEYRAPIGSKRDGCPTCAPTLDAALDDATRQALAGGAFVPLDDGIPF